jgi:hypothetical protein
MIPTQEHPGQYWRSSDPADIWLNEAGAESPTLITCQTPQGGTATVRVDDLKFIGAGLFGDGRPCLGGGNVNWTGASYRYGVYLVHKRSCGCDPTVVWRRCGRAHAFVYHQRRDMGAPCRHVQT